MEFFAGISVNLHLFQALDIPEHLRKPLTLARKACLATANVDEMYVNQSKNGYIPDRPEMGCYINCLFDHFGMKTPDGIVIWDKVFHLLPPTFQETAVFVTNECGTIRKLFKHLFRSILV